MLPSVSAPLPPPALPLVGEVEAFLQDAVQQLAPDLGHRQSGGGRPRVLPALALWAGLVVCVLRGFGHQRDLWRLLADRGLWSYPRFPLSDQAIYKRLESGSPTDPDWHSPLERLFAQLTTLLAARLTPFQPQTLASFATDVLALDETTLDQVARSLPTLRPVPAGDARLLPGKLTGLFDLRRQQWRQVAYQAHPHQNEKVACWDILAHLPAGCLLLADLGYFAFAWFDALSDHGCFWRSRLRAKTSFTVLHAYFDDGRTFDGLVWLGAYRADKAAHAVRLVRSPVGHSRRSDRTSVLDPAALPLAEVARRSARRWDIELAFQTVKRELGLHLLWSATPRGILHPVWAVLCIAQILQALQGEIAARAGVDVFDVSLPLLIRSLPRSAQAGIDPIAGFLAHGRALGFSRPSSRTVIRAPRIPPAKLVPRPPDLVLTRLPRYAERRRSSRTSAHTGD
jgi:hypothetical protein